MSKIADANYTLKATAEEGEAFQVLGVGDSESRLSVSFFFLFLVVGTRDSHSGLGEDAHTDVLLTSGVSTALRSPCWTG